MNEVTAMRLLGLQVGGVAPLTAGDRVVMSGIHKRAVAGPVAVGRIGLAGDEQADPTVHGGLETSLYVGDRLLFADCELVAGPRETTLMSLFPSSRRGTG